MSRQPVVPLAPNVWRIPLIRDFVNGFMFRDDDGQVTLVDMGVKSSGPKVIAALETIGAGPSDVTRLMLTHAHPDHAGGAAHVARTTGRDFALHEDDAGYAAAGQGPPRDHTTRLGRLMDRLSPSKFEAVAVGETFTDGQVVPVAGGLQVVHTPGHTPGHAAYLHLPTGVLITGDSVFNVRQLRWPLRAFCTDYRQNEQTAQRLVDLDYTTAAFTHGTELRVNPREHIRRFLTRQGVI